MAVESGDHAWYWNENISMDLNIPRALWFPGSDPNDPVDFLGNGKQIFNYVFHDNDTILRGQPQMRKGPGTHAWINNNPGNLTGKPGGPDFGQYQGKFNWHHFLIFPDFETGFAAIALFLQQPHFVNLNLLDAFEKYAPAADGNDPVRYANEVATAAGIPLSTTIAELDTDQMRLMQEKIVSIEGSIEGDTFSYSSDELPDAIKNLIA